MTGPGLQPSLLRLDANGGLAWLLQNSCPSAIDPIAVTFSSWHFGIVQRIIALAARFDRSVDRFRSLFNALGWFCFAVICADYAQFINLPPIALVPIWAAMLVNVGRWAIWEGLIKARIRTAFGQLPGKSETNSSQSKRD